MPVLPIIDLLIFLGWTSLFAGGLLKAIYIATSYRPTLFSLAPSDLLLVALGFLGLALTLAARTWVRLNEPQLTAQRRAAASRDAVSRAVAHDQVVSAQPVSAEVMADPMPGAPMATVAGDPDSPSDETGSLQQWQRVR